LLKEDGKDGAIHKQRVVFFKQKNAYSYRAYCLFLKPKRFIGRT